MRTLVVTVDSAWPPVSGAELRNWRNACALAELGSVALASVRPQAPRTPPDHPGIEIVETPPPLTGRSEPAFARPSMRMEPAISRSTASRIAAFAGRFRPDAIVLGGIPLHALMPMLRPLTGNLILDMHNVESELAQMMRAARFGPFAGLGRFINGEPERIRRAERAALALVDRVWLCSRIDRERLLAFAQAGCRTHIVPNSIPAFTDRVSEQPDAVIAGGRPTILYVGHLGYRPNADAVQRLVQRIMPRVRQHWPGARLLVVGRNPRLSVRNLVARPYTELVADPVSVAPFLAQAHLAIIPLMAGGGTRIKILEAMAAGIPVVATRLAAEGLDLVDDVHIRFAESDEDFAVAVDLLCRDARRWREQRDAARAHVSEHFGEAAIARAVAKALN